MNLRRTFFVLITASMCCALPLAASAQMPKRLPAKAPRERAQEYFNTQSHSETASDEVFDVRLKPNLNPPSSSFDYEEALKNSEMPRGTKNKPVVARKQLVSFPKRGVASTKEPKLRLYRTKTKPKRKRRK